MKKVRSKPNTYEMIRTKMGDEAMKELKKQLYLMKNDIWSTIFTEIILFLVGQIIFSIGMYLSNDDETVFEQGTCLALAAVCFLQLFSGFYITARNFSTTVIMSGTRREFIWTHALLSYVQCIVTMLLVYLFHLLELWKLRTFYADKVLEFNFSVLFQWKYMLAICFAILVFRMFVGALYLKFGQKVYWVIWGLWIVIAAGADKLSDLVKDTLGEDKSDFLRQISIDWLVCGGLLAAAIFFVAACAIFRRQQADFV